MSDDDMATYRANYDRAGMGWLLCGVKQKVFQKCVDRRENWKYINHTNNATEQTK